LNIPEFSMGAIPMGMMQAGAGGAAAAPAEEAEAEPAQAAVQTKFAVKLIEFDKIIKIKLIKEIRALTDIGLKEAKDIVDNVPSDIIKDVDKTKAEEIAKVLKETGAVVTIE
jgi:large subunit ribosomal protein L7/L12